MKRNVGNGDRYFRVAVGIIVIAVGLYWETWWGAIGLLPLLTGAMGWCPAYLPLGLSSRKGDHLTEASTEGNK
ncbi:MAG: DUF2892 domain-containing protein [Candidatus Delongbacteria bacterium]|nr:DUF2892 domain-containing protein [bacterium]MBL7032545.1 DUF2892 domain-containing protein [Candidatus Delongbacteria bacterium]